MADSVPDAPPAPSGASRFLSGVKKGRRRTYSAIQRSDFYQKSSGTLVLDSQHSLKLGVIISNKKHELGVSEGGLITRCLDMDESVVNADFARTILDHVTEGEMRLIHEYTGADRMPEAELFLHATKCMPEFYHRLPCIIFRADFREAIDQIEALGAQLLADAVLLKNVQDAGIKEAIKAQNKVFSALAAEESGEQEEATAARQILYMFQDMFNSTKDIRARIIELKQTLTKYALSMKAIDKVNTQLHDVMSSNTVDKYLDEMIAFEIEATPRLRALTDLLIEVDNVVLLFEVEQQFESALSTPRAGAADANAQPKADLLQEISESSKYYLNKTETTEKRMASWDGKWCNASGLGVPVVPPGICASTTLEDLNLSMNQIHVLPDDIGNLQNLISLDLSHNRIEYLPSTFSSLRALQYLDLANNQLVQLPIQLAKMESLVVLDVRNNELVSIPTWIASLDSLTEFKADGNPALEEGDLASVVPSVLLAHLRKLADRLP